MTPSQAKVGCIMRWIPLIAFLALSACANSPQDECGGRVLLLWPTASKTFSFQEIQLSTLISPYELKGSAVEVFVENGISDEGFSGSPARPRLTRTSGGVCVPMDTESSVSLAAYAHFERLQKFDQELKVDAQVNWPRKVGVDIHLRSPDGGIHNNAHYLSRADATAVIPYSMGGLNLALNPGVLAHEHFHAHFQTQVNRPLNESLEVVTAAEEFFYSVLSLKPTVEDVEHHDVNSTLGLNKFVLRAWNEGLADLYGAIYSGQSDFFTVSLPNLEQVRDLSAPLGFFQSGDGFAATPRGPGNPLAEVGKSYEQGALLARVLYRIAMNSELPPKEFLSRLMKRLEHIPSAVANAFSKRVLSFDEVLPVLLNDMSLNPAACGVLRQTMNKTVRQGSFSQCAW
jgi:hypothetical protein